MKKILVTIALVLVTAPVLTLALEANAPWESDGRVVEDDSWENMEIVQVDDDTYRMYYAQGGSIYSATSPKGLNWTVEDGVRVSQAGPGLSVLQLEDGSWRLYFTRTVDEQAVLYSAISSDGLTFTKEDGARLEAGHVRGYDSASGIVHPSVIQTYDGRYRVYYDTFNTVDGGDDPWRILSAVSDDGLDFTIETGIRINPSRDLPDGTQSAWSPYIRKAHGTYYLYFGAEYDSKPLTRNGIYVAQSTNGTDFEVNPEPLVYRNPNLGDAVNMDKGMNGAPQDPMVLRMNGKLRLFSWVVDKGIIRSTYNR